MNYRLAVHVGRRGGGVIAVLAMIAGLMVAVHPAGAQPRSDLPPVDIDAPDDGPPVGAASAAATPAQGVTLVTLGASGGCGGTTAVNGATSGPLVDDCNNLLALIVHENS